MYKNEIGTNIKKRRKKLGYINRALTVVDRQIKKEHSQICEASEFLEQNYSEACIELDMIREKIKKQNSEIEMFKSQIRKLRKKYGYSLEVISAKNWYKLLTEAKIVGEQIDRGKKNENMLEMEQLACTYKKEVAERNLEYYRKGLHKTPVEQDFRMKSVLKEKRRIESYLESMGVGYR